MKNSSTSSCRTKLAAVKFGWEPRWFNPDLEKWLHRITVPTHVVWGREDKILPSAYAKLWGERVPGAQVSMIEACGHSSARRAIRPDRR